MIKTSKEMNITYPKLGAALKTAAAKLGKPNPWYSCSWPVTHVATVRLGAIPHQRPRAGSRQEGGTFADSFVLIAVAEATMQHLYKVGLDDSVTLC